MQFGEGCPSGHLAVVNEQVATVGRRAFAQSIFYTNCIPSWIWVLFCFSCLSHFLFRLLQCGLFRATLEDYKEATPSPECNYVSYYGTSHFDHVQCSPISLLQENLK